MSRFDLVMIFLIVLASGSLLAAISTDASGGAMGLPVPMGVLCAIYTLSLLAVAACLVFRDLNSRKADVNAKTWPRRGPLR